MHRFSDAVALLLLFIQRRQYCRRQTPGPFNVGCHRPEVLIRIPLSVCEHAGTPNPVLRDPEDLRLRVLCADLMKLRNRRKERPTIILRGVGRAVAPRAIVQVEFAASYQVVICRRDRVGYFRSTPFDRRMHGSVHQSALKRRWPFVAPHLREA